MGGKEQAMEHDFWHARWEAGQTGFHQREVNGALQRHGAAAGIVPGARVFLPLCGKTRDIGWLLAQGAKVAGAELSPIAVRDLFADLGVAAEVTALGAVERWAGPGVEVFVGDIMAVTAEMLGPVDAVFDRAALVALPGEMRGDYAAQVTTIAGGVPQLLITFDYDQSLIAGPPFSVGEEEVRRLYGGSYAVTCLERGDLFGGVRGVPAADVAWLLR
jgi:thiopurine S-methyltransferase